MKFLLWTAVAVAMLFAITGPVLLAGLPVWTGQWMAWMQLDPRPWMTLGPWIVPVWKPGFAQDLGVALVLYAMVVGAVCLLHQGWHQLTMPHAGQLRPGYHH
jgi:hypothetical protein